MDLFFSHKKFILAVIPLLLLHLFYRLVLPFMGFCVQQPYFSDPFYTCASDFAQAMQHWILVIVFGGVNYFVLSIRMVSKHIVLYFLYLVLFLILVPFLIGFPYLVID